LARQVDLFWRHFDERIDRTGGNMKKWLVSFAVPLALWLWWSWWRLHAGLYKAVSPPQSPGPGYRSPWWGSGLFVAIYIGTFLFVVLVIVGLAQGKLRFGTGQLAPAGGYLLGCAAAFVAVALPTSTMFCHLGAGPDILGWALAVPALVLMALSTPARTEVGGEFLN
jgi:hypothetical protein